MEKDAIWVVASENMALRGESSFRKLKIEELSVNFNLFLEQIGSLLDKTPEKFGKFHLDEFEVHAEITGKGELVIKGATGELREMGGLRFVFRRSSGSHNRKS